MCAIFIFVEPANNQSQIQQFILNSNNQPKNQPLQYIQHISSQQGINKSKSNSNSISATSTSHSFVISSSPNDSQNLSSRQPQLQNNILKSQIVRIQPYIPQSNLNSNVNTQQISSPICLASTDISLNPVLQSKVTQNTSQNSSNQPFKQNILHTPFIPQNVNKLSGPLGLESLKISESPFSCIQDSNLINNRASFLNRNKDTSQPTNRKPEELDAVANELLSEFIQKKTDILVNVSNEETAPTVPISLSPLSSSSTSSHSSRSSSASPTSSSSNDSIEKEKAIEIIQENDFSQNKNSKESIKNKNGTLIIRRDNGVSNNALLVPTSLYTTSSSDKLLNTSYNNQEQIKKSINDQLNVGSAISNKNGEEVKDYIKKAATNIGSGVGSGIGLGSIMLPSTNFESQFSNQQVNI